MYQIIDLISSNKLNYNSHYFIIFIFLTDYDNIFSENDENICYDGYFWKRKSSLGDGHKIKSCKNIYGKDIFFE